MPSTTSPVVVHSHTPIPVELPPSTTTQLAATPTPTAVLSLSALRMREGTASLPPVNETASANAPGALTPPKDAGMQGRADSATRSSEPATGQGSANSGSGQDDPAKTRITLPKDGQFGAVVVGNALEDQFPEVTGVWGDRMAYTVYLHVGLNRSWILQYSLPRTAEAEAAGNIGNLEAPWPYSIVRPNLAPGSIDADALMVHGYVSPSGRFENLKIAFPQGFPQTEFVLKSLEQWQFRPATQDGQAAWVEVLLIIPEDLE